MNIAPQWARDRVVAICTALDVSLEDIFDCGRAEATTHARRICVYVLREYSGPVSLSFPDIAAATNCNNHSTVIGQYNKAKDMPEVVRQADELARALGYRKRIPLPLKLAGGQVV